MCSWSWLWWVWCGGTDGGVGWYACETKPGRLVVCQSTSLRKCEVKTLMTSDHTAFQAQSHGRVDSELAGLPRKALTQDATRRLRFVVHAAGLLDSTVLDERKGYVRSEKIALKNNITINMIRAKYIKKVYSLVLLTCLLPSLRHQTYNKQICQKDNVIPFQTLPL